MKAIISKTFGGPDVLQLGEAPIPQINDHEILIEVHASALNRADTLQRMGKYPPPKGESNIIGLEVSGVVSKIGSAVDKWKIGDRVCALLAGGEYAKVLDELDIFPNPVNSILYVEYNEKLYQNLQFKAYNMQGQSMNDTMLIKQ